METLTNLALIGVPAVGVLALGVAWLTRSVFKDVSLNDVPADDQRVINAEQRAEGLGFQLAIAEELGLDAGSLNTLKDRVDLAEEDADRARQTQEEREEVPVAVPVPWFSPVAAVHSASMPQRREISGE